MNKEGRPVKKLMLMLAVLLAIASAPAYNQYAYAYLEHKGPNAGQIVDLGHKNTAAPCVKEEPVCMKEVVNGKEVYVCKHENKDSGPCVKHNGCPEGHKGCSEPDSK
jgi:hypothetical protein